MPVHLPTNISFLCEYPNTDVTVTFLKPLPETNEGCFATGARSLRPPVGLLSSRETPFLLVFLCSRQRRVKSELITTSSLRAASVCVWQDHEQVLAGWNDRLSLRLGSGAIPPRPGCASTVANAGCSVVAQLLPHSADVGDLWLRPTAGCLAKHATQRRSIV